MTHDTPAAVAEDGTTIINGKSYLPDAKGAFVPVELVKPQHKLEDETVRKIIGFARSLSAQIARFRGHTMTDLGEFDALLEQEYGGRRGGAKGNRTSQTFAGHDRLRPGTSDRQGPNRRVPERMVRRCEAGNPRRRHPRLQHRQGGAD